MELSKRIEACLMILLILLIRFSIDENVYADSYTVFENSPVISMRISGTLSNGVFVEASLENRIPMNVSTGFRPGSLNFSTQGSTLLIVYDARIPEDILMQVVNVEEIGGVFDDEWLKIIELLVVFATGLALLAFEMFSSKTRGEDVLKIIEKGEAPPRGSVVSEELLLLLSSKNPEAYRRAVDMVLKGELKVKRKRLRHLRKAFSKAMGFVNLRRLFLF